MGRKFVYYLQNNKVVITDHDDNDPIEYITSKINEIMSGTKIGLFKTKTDSLLIRPEDIRGVHIIEDHKEEIKKEIHMDLEDVIGKDKLQKSVPDIDLGDIDTEITDPQQEDILPDLEAENDEQKNDTEEVKEETPDVPISD